jgi:hypothetical protein
MVIRTSVAGGLCALVWSATVTTTAAQTATSSTAARELVSLMDQRGAEAFAAQDRDAPHRFIASLLIPGVQLLVVSADYPTPEVLRAQLAQKNYREVYGALHQPVSASSRFFLIDLGCDGINTKDGPVDVLYERGTEQTLFNGNWKGQGLSEAAYKHRVVDAEQRYIGILNSLRDGLKASTR